MTHFQATNQALLQLAVDSLARAPHFTPEETRSRTEAVISAVMAFLPTEPVQTMLATQAAGHHFTLLDTFRELTSNAPTGNVSVRLRAITTQQTKVMLMLVRELRAVRKDMIAAAEAEQQAHAAAAVQTAPDPEPEPPADEQAQTDSAIFAAHAADYEAALADLQAALEEARALDKPSARTARRHLELIN